MKKDECEQAIRQLCREFSKETTTPMDGSGEYNFTKFYYWIKEKYPKYLEFKSTIGTMDTVEKWWRDEFNQPFLD